MNVVMRKIEGIIVEHSIDGVDQMSDAERAIAPLPRAQAWPIALLPLKLFAKDADRGAGDIIARTIGPIGGEAFKVWYKKLFGKDCGCGPKQEVLNARWPL